MIHKKHEKITDIFKTNFECIVIGISAVTHRSHGLTLPLRNATKKRTVVLNTLGYSDKDDKELQSSFPKNVWPF